MREEPNKNSDGQVDMEELQCLNHKSCTANCRCDFFQNSRQRVRLHSVVTSLRNDRPSQVDADKFEETENPHDGKDDRTASPKCKTLRKRDTTEITSNARREFFDFVMNKKKSKQRKQLAETSIEVVDQSVESTCVTVVSSSDSKNDTSNSESTALSQPQDPVLLNLDSQANTTQLPFIPAGMPPVMSFPGGNQQALVFLVGSPGMPVTGDLTGFGNMAPGAPFANAVFLGQPLTLNVVSPDGSSTGGVIEKAMELANVGTNSLGSGGQNPTQGSSDLVVSQGEFLGQSSHCTLQSVASQSTFPADSSYNTLPQVSQGIVIAPSVTGENMSIDNVSQSVTIQTSQVSQNQVGNGATFLQILNAAAASSGPEISPPKMIYKRKGASYREVMTQTGGDPEVIILSEGKKQFEEDQLMEEATDNEKEITAAKKPGSEKVRRFTCDICDKKFYTNHDLRRHHTIHQDSRPFVCEVCQKTFRTHGELKLHIAIHNEDTPYKCEFCGKEFRTKGCVKSHVKYHIGDKRHKCTECDSAFVKSADLKRHMAGHRNEKKFVCDDCGSAFTRRDNLKAHRLLHSRESVVTCDLCSKEFINAVYLKRHMHIHKQAKKKPYECQWCPKTYEQLEGLRRHIRQHVGDEKFVCKHCAKKFITSIQLKRHLWLSHEQDSPYRRSIL